MALSDLAVYSEYAYTTKNELLDYNIELFNGVLQGAIRLRPSAHQGDYSDETFWKKLPGGAVRRRNAYADNTIPQQRMQMGVDTSVKVAAGTNEVIFQPSDLKWIQMDPRAAGVAYGEQLAMDALADMLNTSIGCFTAAMKGVPGKVLDITAQTGDAAKASFIAQARAAALMGDNSATLRAWVMHSAPATDLFVNALANNNGLFSYGSVNVMRDPMGRPFVISDAPSLIGPNVGGVPTFYTLGLKRDAIKVGENNDRTEMERNITGRENLQLAYQAEWTFQVGLDGFAWDKATGGHSPNDAALFTTANWDKVVTSEKNIGGVMLVTK